MSKKFIEAEFPISELEEFSASKKSDPFRKISTINH